MENNEKKNWVITYLDCNNDVVHSDHYQDITYVEAIYNAENKPPKIQIIDDYSITEEYPADTILVEDPGFTDWLDKTNPPITNFKYDPGYNDYLNRV